ncbi:MAG: hypothetical protein AAF694_26470 [Bacteroidota bacterium]
MTKLELKGRILELIAQIDDRSALEDIYRLADLMHGKEGGASEEGILNSPGPAAGQTTMDSDRKEDDLSYPKYFSY